MKDLAWIVCIENLDHGFVSWTFWTIFKDKAHIRLHDNKRNGKYPAHTRKKPGADPALEKEAFF
jgi:hypothetical protein